MRYTHLVLICMLALLIAAQPAFAQEQSGKEKYEARLKSLGDQFFAAQKAGKTIKGVIVEGNSLFNGTTEPQKKPYGKPYTDAERKKALQKRRAQQQGVPAGEGRNALLPDGEEGAGGIGKHGGIPL